MPDGTQDLIKTIAVLSACIVYLSKQAIESYKAKRTGPQKIVDCGLLVKELHKWHQPVVDPGTGQPKFMWYENNSELEKELRANRESMEALRDSTRKTRESMDRLIAAMERRRSEA